MGHFSGPDWLVSFVWHMPEALRRLTRCFGISCRDITRDLSFLLFNLAQPSVNLKRGLTLVVYYQGYCLAIRPAPPKAPLLRTRNADQVIPGITNSGELARPITAAKKPSQPKLSHDTKPGPDHPWRRPFKILINRG